MQKISNALLQNLLALEDAQHLRGRPRPPAEMAALEEDLKKWGRNELPHIEDRMLELIKKTETCWEWAGGRDGGGYGKIFLRWRSFQAHRVSYTLFKGEIPDGLTLDHLCRNKACVNPDHLEPVTPTENTRRMLTHKRTTMAERTTMTDETHIPMPRQLNLRCTEAQLADWRRAAGAKGLSAWLRELADHAAHPTEGKAEKEPDAMDRFREKFVTGVLDGAPPFTRPGTLAEAWEAYDKKAYLAAEIASAKLKMEAKDKHFKSNLHNLPTLGHRPTETRYEHILCPYDRLEAREEQVRHEVMKQVKCPCGCERTITRTNSSGGYGPYWRFACECPACRSRVVLDFREEVGVGSMMPAPKFDPAWKSKFM